MRGDDQVPVVGPGEPLGLALAAAVGAQLAEQVRPVAGPVARHPGDADPAAARAAHPDQRPGPARGPGAAFRRPQPLPRLVLEADEGAQVARHPLSPATPRPSTPRPRHRPVPWPGAPEPGKTSRAGASASRP